MWQRYTNGDVEIINGLDTIRDAGLMMAKGMANESKDDVINAMKMNSSGVDILGLELHQPFRTKLDQLSAEGKVSAWKAMGAGGGGVVGMFITDLSLQHSLIDELGAEGWSNIPWQIDNNGVVRTEINL